LRRDLSCQWKSFGAVDAGLGGALVVAHCGLFACDGVGGGVMFWMCLRISEEVVEIVVVKSQECLPYLTK